MEEIVSTLTIILISHYFRPEAYILEGGGCMNPGTTMLGPDRSSLDLDGVHQQWADFGSRHVSTN